MSDYNWCHGPSCHTKHTQSRVRGSGDNKVLRTIKIKQGSEWIRQSIYSYFCNQNCLLDFLNAHKDRIVALDPRREARETKIKDPIKETHNTEWGRTWTSTTIEKIGVDNT